MFKLVLLFLRLSAAFDSTFNKRHVEIIKDFHLHYNFTEIFIVFRKEIIFNFTDLLKSMMTIPVAFNIHSEDSLDSFNFQEKELIVIIPDSFDFQANLSNWKKLYKMSKSKLIMFIPLIDMNLLLKPMFTNKLKDTGVLQNGSIYRFECYKPSLTLSSVEHFVAHDTTNFPEDNWPRIELIHHDGRHKRNFPLINYIGNGVNLSGLVGYMHSELRKYVNNRLERKRVYGNKGNLNSRHHQNLIVHITFIENNIFIKQYPLRTFKACFITPVLDEILTHQFIKRPFSSTSWTTIFLTMLFLTISLRSLIFRDLFKSFFESLTASFGSVHSGHKRNNRERLIYIQMFLYGFIISNLYNAKLSSYLTSPDFGKTLETIENIKKANLTLWSTFNKHIQDDLVKHYPLIYQLREEALKGILKTDIQFNTFYEHLFQFDTNQGYLIWDFMWSYIKLSQYLLKKKIFKMTKICPMIGFVQPFDLYTSNFEANLNDLLSHFTMRIQSSGLDYIWQKRSYRDMHFRFMRVFVEDWRPLGFMYFKIAWWILFCGISIGFCSFVVEMIFKKW
ncbi:hypothetical protein ACFFRR_007815 [Megaselia abdita]